VQPGTDRAVHPLVYQPDAPPLDPSDPLTLADWARAYGSGASPLQTLLALHRRLEVESPPGVWIALVDGAGIEAQVEALQARAARLDGARRRAELPFFGVPFAVKDNIDVAGMPTTAACPAFAYTPTQHANAVARLIDAGAVCVGKTNLDQFATGLVGARSPYGRPSSTFDPERISGGSSSGSAVVVSRGDVPFALGTDTAGSGRVPAGFNQVVGLKPTPGRVGTSGVVPACRSLDCLAVFALTVADAASVLAVLEGPDAGDAYSHFAVGAARFGASLRIGIPSHAVFSGDAGYRSAYEEAVGHVEALGHRVVAVDFAPLHAVAELLYAGPWVAERHAVVEALLTTQPDAIDPVVAGVVGAARSLSATDAFRGQYALQAARRDTRALWAEVDLLMVPTAPGHPRHAEVDAEPVAVNAQLGTYTNFVNLLGWCALALPAGATAEGLPFGVTFIAPAAADAALARFGVAWQESLRLPLGATTRPFPAPVVDAPGRWPASEATLPIAVVGAHLSGLPLNAQLTERGAVRREATTTAPAYRLYALPGTSPPKPGMLRVDAGGAAIAVEVWDLPSRAVGSFLALVPAPLGLGSVALADGRSVHGFLCEAHALEGALDITGHGGWRAYLSHLRADTASTP
jgi:allophanate hydrolase